VTLAELLFGIAALAASKRKYALTAALEGPRGLFRDRLLPFDIAAGRRYGELAVKAKAGGRRFPTCDGYIANARRKISGLPRRLHLLAMTCAPGASR